MRLAGSRIHHRNAKDRTPIENGSRDPATSLPIVARTKLPIEIIDALAIAVDRPASRFPLPRSSEIAETQNIGFGLMQILEIVPLFDRVV